MSSKISRCDCVDNQPGDWDIAKRLSYGNPAGQASRCYRLLLLTRRYRLGTGVIADAGKDKQIFVGGIDGMTPAIQAIATAKWSQRPQLCHSCPCLGDGPGAYAATVGLEQAGMTYRSLFCRRSVILSDVDSERRLQRYAWKLKAYGLGTAPRSNLD